MKEVKLDIEEKDILLGRAKGDIKKGDYVWSDNIEFMLLEVKEVENG